MKNNAKYIILILLLGGLTFLVLNMDSSEEKEVVEIDSSAAMTGIELGKKLFFDPILSLDTTISCASCHQPKFAFADNVAFSVGVRGQLGDRNAPSCMNMSARAHFFYDGRAATLEEQAVQPIHNPVEMDLTLTEAIQRLKNSPYQALFEQIYPEETLDENLLGKALAEFMFTLESPGDSRFDRFVNGEEDAMTASEINGRAIFIGKAKCFDCHFSPDFTADEFKNIGLYNGSDTLNDVGRFGVTKDSSDLGKMKVSGLRNIAMTPPYMHNGMFQTLEEVVEYYNDPSQFVQNPINMDTLLAKPLDLTEQEKADLVAFMKALTDEQFAAKAQ